MRSSAGNAGGRASGTGAIVPRGKWIEMAARLQSTALLKRSYIYRRCVGISLVSILPNPAS